MSVPERHPWLDQHLVPVGEPLRAIAAGMLDHLEGHEAATNARKRARSIAGRAVFRDLVDITAANLALAVLRPPPSGALAVRAGNLAKALTRYDHPAFGEQFRPLMKHLAETGFATLDVSGRRGEVSALAPTAKFAGLVRASGVTMNDFGRHPDEEVILLTRKLAPREDPGRRDREDYRDNATTKAMRAQLRRLNGFLAGADIAFVPDGVAPAVNDRDRRLSRRFFIGPDDKPRFDRGGRLFGGFWLNLGADRRHAIRIEGEPVGDLDFQSMFCRLAYAELGRTPPEGDLYALPGLEGYRSGVKLALNTLFWDETRRRKYWPEGMGVGMGDDGAAKERPNGFAGAFKGRLPAGWENPARLIGAILERHPGLEPALGRSLGATLMFRESQIMVACLSELMAGDVVALPLHDGLMVAHSRKAQAKATMERVTVRMTGGVFPVVEKGVRPPRPILADLLAVTC